MLKFIQDVLHYIYSIEEGVTFGNPRDPSSAVLMGITREQLWSAENSGITPEKLAVNLLLILFSEAELARGNCTKPQREDIQLLDQYKISAIRGK